jgi:hypothetical protein
MNKRTTGVIVKRRLGTAARDKYFTPFYTVKLTGTKVNNKKSHALFQGVYVYFYVLNQYVSSCAQQMFSNAGVLYG